MADKADVKEMGLQDHPKKSLEATEVENTNALDADELFLRQHDLHDEHLQELLRDEEKNKKLVRKVDRLLLPFLAGTYVLQYIDKQALGYAAVFDLFTDTGISGTQYSWLPSIFYFAYITAEYPWVFLAQRTQTAKVVSTCVFCWGCVLLGTAASHNFTGLAVSRFFLGFFEAPITTLFMMTVAQWYIRKDQPFRAGIFYCCNGVGSRLGGIFSYAIGQIDSFPVWKAVFLVCGGLTVVWGGVLVYFLPDSIITARFFTTEEKALLIGRARLGRTGVLNKHIKWYQVKEALIDPQVWILTLFVLFNEVINGGIANFGKLIIKGLVKDPLLATALGIPHGAFQIFWILGGTFLASKVKNFRTAVMAIYLIPTMIGVSLIWKLDRTHHGIGVLFGYYIQGSFVASLVLALQMPATNLGGYTKRTMASAIVFTAYCVGNIIGPHAFLDHEAPLYPTGCTVILCCSVAQMILAVVLRVFLTWRNKKRDAQQQEAGTLEAPEAAGSDLTDFENPHFRYVL